MTRRFYQVVAAMLTLLVLVIANFQLAREEMHYPLGTQAQTVLSFSHVDISKSEIVRQMRQVAQKHGDFYLIKIDRRDPIHGLDLYQFSNATPSQQQVHWLQLGRYGELRAAQDIGSANLSGNYAFQSWQQCHAVIASLRSTVSNIQGSQQCASRQGSPWLVQVTRTESVLYLVVALAVLVLASVWAWIGGLARSQSIRLMNGVPPYIIWLQDAASLFRVIALPMLGVYVASFIYVVGIRRFGNILLYAQLSSGSVGALLVSMVAVAVIVAAAVYPRVSQVAHRKDNSIIIRLGNTLFSCVCLIVILTVLPFASASATLAQQQVRNSAMWNHAANAVSVQVRSSGVEQEQALMKNYQQFFTLADRDGIVAISAATGDSFAADISEEDKPLYIDGVHDEVIVASTSFLQLMKIDQRDLRAVSAAEIPASLRKDLEGYSTLWAQRGSHFSLLQHCYEWQGKQQFPALSKFGLTGELSKAQHPLIVVVDDPARVFSTSGFLYPLLTTGNLMFTDEGFLYKDLQQAHLQQDILSINTIADQALYEAQSFRERIIMNIMAAISGALLIIVEAIQSAKVWAERKRKAIFVLHSSGRSYCSILRWHLCLQVVLVAALAALVYWKQSMWNDVPYGAVIFCTITGLYIALHVVTSFLATSHVFRKMALREE